VTGKTCPRLPGTATGKTGNHHINATRNGTHRLIRRVCPPPSDARPVSTGSISCVAQKFPDSRTSGTPCPSPTRRTGPRHSRQSPPSRALLALSSRKIPVQDHLAGITEQRIARTVAKSVAACVFGPPHSTGRNRLSNTRPDRRQGRTFRSKHHHNVRAEQLWIHRASGVSSCFDPSRWLLKVTPFRVSLRQTDRLHDLKPAGIREGWVYPSSCNCRPPNGRSVQQ